MDKVKEYLERQSNKNKIIIKKLRSIILNFKDLKETTMKEGLWYQGKFYITSFSDHVNLGIGINGLSKNEADLFEGKGKTLRHLKFYSLSDINNNTLSLMKLAYNKSKCKINWE